MKQINLKLQNLDPILFLRLLALIQPRISEAESSRLAKSSTSSTSNANRGGHFSTSKMASATSGRPDHVTLSRQVSLNVQGALLQSLIILQSSSEATSGDMDTILSRQVRHFNVPSLAGTIVYLTVEFFGKDTTRSESSGNHGRGGVKRYFGDEVHSFPSRRTNRPGSIPSAYSDLGTQRSIPFKDSHSL